MIASEMQDSIKNISPANFAFVMATGITSILLLKTEWLHLSHIFLFIGMMGYVFLVGIFATRLMMLRGKIQQDVRDTQKMFKYLTFGAGSNALATGSLLLGYDEIGIILSIIGVLSTILLIYTLFCTLFFHFQIPIQRISPFWLLLAIASNSSGIVITSLWNKEIIAHPFFLVLAFSFWTFGVLIYLILMTLNVYRMLFFPFKGEDLDPCYWTCMGAAAIAVVDGCQFVLTQHPPLFVHTVKPFIEGMVLFLWAWGTAWIPILCLMGLWKYFYFKIPFQYQPSLWAMVFPMGMYACAMNMLSKSLQMGFLDEMVQIWLWITLFVWGLVACMSRFNPFTHSN